MFFLLLFISIIVVGCEQGNYQMTGIGNGQIAVLDTRTGEVWMSECDPRELDIPNLRPREYKYTQVEASIYGKNRCYIPEKSRNKENCNFLEKVNRIFTDETR